MKVSALAIGNAALTKGHLCCFFFAFPMTIIERGYSLSRKNRVIALCAGSGTVIRHRHSHGVVNSAIGGAIGNRFTIKA